MPRRSGPPPPRTGQSPPSPPPAASESSAAQPPSAEDAESFPRIDGSTANHPLITRIYSEICGISREEAETLVDLDLGSTGSIWQKMLYGGESCLLIVYEPPEEVKEASAAELAQLEIDPIGRDGLVFLANAQNPVESLTVEELRKIYTAQLTDWSEVGGEPGPIQPFQRNPDSGSQTLFEAADAGQTADDAANRAGAADNGRSD